MLGAFKAAGAAGLLIGLLGVRPLGIAAAVGLVAFFVGAVITHIRARVLQHRFSWAVFGAGDRLAARVYFGLTKAAAETGNQHAAILRTAEDTCSVLNTHCAHLVCVSRRLIVVPPPGSARGPVGIQTERPHRPAGADHPLSSTPPCDTCPAVTEWARRPSLRIPAAGASDTSSTRLAGRPRFRFPTEKLAENSKRPSIQLVHRR
jgi:hypothetical protein